MPKKNYLLTWLLLSLFGGLSESFYHLSDTRTDLCLSADEKGKTSKQLSNCQEMLLTKRETSQTTLGFLLDKLLIDKDVQVKLQTIQYAPAWQFYLCSYLNYFPQSLKNSPLAHKLFLTCRTQALETALFSLKKEPTSISLITALNTKTDSFSSKGCFFSNFLFYVVVSSLVFGVALLPLLFWRKPQEKHLLSLLRNDRLLVSLCVLSCVCWSFYSYHLAQAAYLFSPASLLKLLSYGLYVLAGCLVYALLSGAIWLSVRRRCLILRFVALLFLLALNAVIIVQAIFLDFTSAPLNASYFTMLTRENINLFLTWPVLLTVVILISVGLWLVSQQKLKAINTKWLWRVVPCLGLTTYYIGLVNLGLLRWEKLAVYRPTQASARLAFSSYFDPLFCFAQEALSYAHILWNAQESSVRLHTLNEGAQQVSRRYGFHLGEEASHFPAGKKPFKRIILLTIEGYRLAYIPQYNPTLANLCVPFPFFSRPEVQKARKRHYYACTAFTTRALKALFLSHLNTLTNNFYLEELKNYPSLAKQLKEAGFKTLFIRTASRQFDQFDCLFRAMGIDKVFEMEELEFLSQKDYEAIGLKTPNAWAYPSRLLFQEVIGQLKRAKQEGEPIFTLILNTDTHNPPKGMAMVKPSHYGELVYPQPLLACTKNLSLSLKNTLTASYRFAYDLDLFFEQLQQEGLWDEETLFIVSADHSQNSPDTSYFANSRQQKLFEEIPLFILTPRNLAPIDQDSYATHLDLGPTLLDLVGLDKPAGYWGRSLYGPASQTGKAWFSYSPDVLYSKDDQGEEDWSLNEHPALRLLWNNFYIR